MIHLLLALVAACTPAAEDDTDDGAALDTAVTWSSDIDAYDVLAEVDPFIGTDDGRFQNLNCFPGAVLPFGMVSVSPDTTSDGDVDAGKHAAGYLGSDPYILGFSHVRHQGTSTPDLGVALVTAARGDATDLVTPDGYRSTKANEVASPGSYAVDLVDHDVHAEVTASRRAGHHRYTWGDRDADHHVVVDMGHALPGVTALAQTVSWDAARSTLTGSVIHAGRFSVGAPLPFQTHVVLKFDPAPSEVRLRDGTGLYDVADLDGLDLGAVLTFDGAEQVEVRVGVSTVDAGGARTNLREEVQQRFEANLRDAEEAWENALSSVRIEGGTAAERRMFTTALYHSFVVPSSGDDADGRYRGLDGEIHTTETPYFTNFSMWDTYRTTHPLITLARPRRAQQLAASLVQMADDGGYLPRWPFGFAYTNTTVGSSADIVLADTYARGVDGFDAEAALDAMVLTATEPVASGTFFNGREAVTEYLDLGYVPVDSEDPNLFEGSPRTVTRTLEYAIADGAIADLATRLGDTEVAEAAATRARSYTHLWDAPTKTFRGRTRDGSWVSPWSQTAGGGESFYGGNAWQYAWMVPHDMAGLIDLHGSDEAFVTALEAFFTTAKADLDAKADGEVWGTSAYWHGNEPDIHAAYLFVAAGRPDLTQHWADWVARAFYDDTANGYAGNEDAGALSAWYVLTSLGLYPVPGTDVWIVGRPAFEAAEIRMPDGSLLTIEAPGAGPDQPYVAGLLLDGDAIDRAWLRHGELVGATLSFTMSATPTAWGRGERPPSP